MLVLTLDNSTGVVIGDDIHVVLVRGRNGRMQLGINAPRAVSVVRDNLPDGQKRAAEIAQRRAAERVDNTSAQRVA